MFRWLLSIVFIISLVVVGIMLEKPKGSVEGKVFLQQYTKGAVNYLYNTDNIKSSNARVIAYGQVIRGAKIGINGKFRIDGLPVGSYRIQVRADGYSSQMEWNVKVKETEVTNIKDIKLNYLYANLDLAADTKVFMPDDTPYIWFSTSAIKDVDFKIYKFDLGDYLESDTIDKTAYVRFLLGNYYYGSYRFAEEMIEGKEPLRSWKQTVSYGQEDYARNRVNIEKKLEKGSYLVVAEGQSFLSKEKKKDIYWFSVSDLGIITKQDPEKMVISAVNLKKLNYEPGVVVKIYDRNSNMALIGEANTDNDGIATYYFDKEDNKEHSSLLVVAKKDEYYALNGSYSWFYTEDKYKVYLYTERPIYRPDQTVYFKGIVRTLEPDGLKNYADEDVEVTIYNPEDEPVKKLSLKTNKFGSYNGLVELPVTAMLGSYSIKSTIAGHSYNNYFEVNEYRKPEYKVDVIPASKLLIGGEKATATVKSTYFFGYPVTNAKVKYSVYASPDYSLKWRLLSRPDYYSFYDDWDDDESFYYTGYDYGDSAGELVAEGYASTDENGEAKISFKTKKVEVKNDEFYSYYESMPQKYWVEAEVTDISRKTSIGKGSFNVVSGDFALFVDPDYYVYTPDQDVRVKVKSIGYDKKPVSAKVTLELQRWEWDEGHWAYKSPKNISVTETMTDKEGEGIAVLDIPESSPTRNYRIVANSFDGAGNKISATTYVWISNYRFAASRGDIKPKIQLTLDKKVYQPGDIAKAMVVFPVYKPDLKMKAMISIEGTRLYDYKIIDVEAPAQMIEIPIEKKYMPNAYVSVSMVGPKQQYYEDSKLLKVSPNRKFLNIDIKPNKTKYMPGDEVKYTIKVTDSYGNPVIADLSVGVVDESIYSIREDFTPDIRKFFYEKRLNLVQTAYSFYKSYSAGGDKIEPKLRKDFKDTAFWSANVVTNEEGMATVKFKLPDNLTTWRTTVRLVTEDTEVSSITDNLLVTQDIIVRLALPRFYTVGDKTVLAGIVHNYTDDKQDLQLKINLPSNFTLIGKDKRVSLPVQVDSNDKIRHDWEIEAKVAGDAKVQLKALSTKISGDAVEHPIEILPFGLLKTEVKSGDTEELEISEKVEGNITEKVVPGSLKWNIRVSPSSAGMILGSLDYLIGYPYGCTEQTMSKFLPSIVVDNVSKSLGVPLSEKSYKKLPVVIDESLNRLYKLQHHDGGWGWWEYDDSDPYMTAYVMFGLKKAIDSGYQIKTEKLNKAVKWLEKYVASKEVDKLIKTKLGENNKPDVYDSRSITDLCYQNYVLALYSKKNDNILNELYNKREKLQSSGMAYLALAFIELNEKPKAEKLVDDLIKRADVSGPVITYSILKHLGYSMNYNSPEVTSIVLRAMQRIRPDSNLNEKMLQYLIDAREGNYWYNTKTTSSVILAIAESVKQSILKEAPDYDLVVKLNGEELQTYHFDKSNVFKKEELIEITDKNTNISDKNILTLEKQGPGKLYYTSEFKYYKLYETNQIIPAVTDNGIKVTKELFRVNSTTDEYGNIKYKEEPLKGSLRAGEILLVKLTVENSKPGEYLIVEDPKASSMELISTDPRQQLNMSFDKESDKYYWWNYWWSHQEDKDTHMAFFIKFLPSGKHIIRYLIRAEFPGEYMMRPTFVEGMYSSLLNGSAESSKLYVEE